MATLDVYQLFIVMLVTALLQEFIIKPTVEFIRHWYHKAYKHLESMK